MKVLLTPSAAIALAFALAFAPASLAVAKSAKARVAPVGYEGVGPACWPGGSRYDTRACCVQRGVSRGGLRSGAENWCLRHGYTK